MNRANFVLIIFGLLLINFLTLFTALALVTFSRLRHVPQPARSLLIGLGSGGIAGVLSIAILFFGDTQTWFSLLVIAAATNLIAGAFIGLLGSSSETISAKTKDDFIRKPEDDGRWWH